MNIQILQASSTLQQLQRKMDTISNNIANLDTAGYRSREVHFQDLLTQTIKNQPHADQEVGRESPYGIRIGSGVKLGATLLRHEQGTPQVTDRPLDLMIEGSQGWFRVLKSWVDQEQNEQTEVHYSRHGSFHVFPNPEAPGEVRLVTGQGDPILDVTDTPISFPSNFEQLNFSEEGTLSVHYPDQEEPLLFQLGITRINRPDLLENTSQLLFRLTGDPEILAESNAFEDVDLRLPGDYQIKIQQGRLEMSNVDMTKELTEMIATQRMFQAQSRAITIANDMMGLVNSIR